MTLENDNAPELALHVEQEREESCIGASEAAGVLGLDKWNPPIAVWRRHRGLPMREVNAAASEAATWGNLLEPVIRGYYATTRRRRIAVPIRSITKGGWLRCTPDGFDVGESEYGFVTRFIDETPEGKPPFDAQGLLQVKTCSAYLLDDWRDGPPPKYEIQCRVEMAVTEMPWCDVVCLVGGQHFIGPYRLERDAAKESRILEPLREFMDLVDSGTEPTVDHTDAWRLHVSEKMERALPVTIPANDNMLDEVAMYRARRVAAAMAERDESEARNRILLRMSAAGATRIDCGEAVGKITAYRSPKGTWALRVPTFWKDDQ